MLSSFTTSTSPTTSLPDARSWLADALVLGGLGGLIYVTFLMAGQWQATFNPIYNIDLSWHALPLYTLFSAARGILAYLLSLAFALSVGYWAAKVPSAERIIIPVIDILQSIPVLAFLPGLVLGLIAIFPNTNFGLELACILMIFTGQVWNMTLAFYSSIKSIPNDLNEASQVMGLSKRSRFLQLELPFGAVNLIWNSVLSMAGGWFFLSVCEAFPLGNRAFRLPGLGAYMAVASERGDHQAEVLGLIAMGLMIVGFDLILWRPLLAWAHRYRLEESEEGGPTEDHLIQFIFSNSQFLHWAKAYFVRRRRLLLFSPSRVWRFPLLPQQNSLSPLIQSILRSMIAWKLHWVLTGIFVIGLGSTLISLSHLLIQVSFSTWLMIFFNAGVTFLRVVLALLISSLWTIPFGVWLSLSPARLRIAQPLVQLLASFPAPMLYPLVIGFLLWLKVNFELSSMILMLMGVQWYILFNVLAGGLRVPQELRFSMDLMGNGPRDRWRYLYLPSIFPSLVTGWVTAAGGAWNTSIVAEYFSFENRTLQAHGLGAMINRSASTGDFKTLAACLLVMVAIVILLNRFCWAPLYRMSEKRFRLDL